MAKKRPRRPQKTAESEQPFEFPRAEPWIARKSGFRIMTLVSLALVVFMSWQLYPTEGLRAILWGLGFGVAIWGIFGISLAFHSWLRGNK